MAFIQNNPSKQFSVINSVAMCLCRLLQAPLALVVEQSADPKATCEALGRRLFSTEELVDDWIPM